MGALVCETSGSCNIENCNVTGSITAVADGDYYSDVNVGGIVGHDMAESLITGCTFTGFVGGAKAEGGGRVAVGGIVGGSDFCSGTELRQCSVSAEVAAMKTVSDRHASDVYAGGIAGFAGSVGFSGCSASGTVVSGISGALGSRYAGGITGCLQYSAKDMVNCWVGAEVYAEAGTDGGTGKAYAGGITGQTSARVIKCTVTSPYIVSSTRTGTAGRIAGEFKGEAKAEGSTFGDRMAVYDGDKLLTDFSDPRHG